MRIWYPLLIRGGRFLKPLRTPRLSRERSRTHAEPERRPQSPLRHPGFLEKHGNDPGQSLAAVGVVPADHKDLGLPTDVDIQSGLTLLPSKPPAASADATLPHVDLAGRRYRILRPHARGGLGEVFVARDKELRREVALKEMQPASARVAAHRARFLLEAEVRGRLEHPGIVPVYGLGCYADGRPFYAMRFIRGDSLKDVIARFHGADEPGRSPGQRVVQLRQLLGRFLDVCDAIEYAHSRGVLHRDLKPDNIMVGKYGETLVVDWGLAKLTHRADVENTEGLLTPPVGDSSLTQVGATLGTPSYMSPEQAEGRLDQVGPRSDVYSLGATLYCLLTGRAPVADGDVGEVLNRVRRGDFPRPRARDTRIPLAREAVRLLAGVSAAEDNAEGQALNNAGFVPRTQSKLVVGRATRHSAVWWKPARTPERKVFSDSWTEEEYEQMLTPSNLQIDLRLAWSPARLERPLRLAAAALAVAPPAGLGGVPWRAPERGREAAEVGLPGVDFGAVWIDSATRVSEEVHGLAPADHVIRCRELAGKGYRPAALTTIEVGDGRLLGGSVWHRPVVPESARDALARRQAQAAVALVQLGAPERVWPLLEHTPDPRLRTFLIHRFAPLKTEAQALLGQLEEEREVSRRRALVLSLGSYPAEALPGRGVAEAQ